MSNRVYTSDGRNKADRALELYEKGLKAAVIAERLGISARHVHGALQRARERREKAKEPTE